MRWHSGYSHRMPLLVLVLAMACSPAFAVEVHAPPSTSRMSALDRENDVVIPPPPPPPSPVIEALPLALGVYGVTAVAGMGAVYLGFVEHAQVVSITGAIAVTSLAPAVAVGVLAHDVPWPVWPAMVVGTVPGIVSGGVIGLIAGTMAADVVRPRGTDCLYCSTEENVALIAPFFLAAGLGGAVGLTTTMFIASAFVPAPDEAP